MVMLRYTTKTDGSVTIEQRFPNIGVIGTIRNGAFRKKKGVRARRAAVQLAEHFARTKR